LSITATNKEARASLIAEAFKQACMAELTALKPGNVHIFADGHGMVVQDFIKSAEAVAAVIAQPDFTVGQRILASVEATWQAVGCNTNLGIILLAAPLVQAAMQDNKADLKTNLHQVLNGLTVQDAELTYQAIQLASPAGLGSSEQHDVSAKPIDTLLVGMQQAQHRDLIARQYSNGYADVFEFGLSRYQDVLDQWQRPAWAISSVYLGFLATYNDSHIFRKYGEAITDKIRLEAVVHDKALLAQENPKLYQRELMDFDSDLKSRGINPGTSADLTVSTLLASMIVSQAN